MKKFLLICILAILAAGIFVGCKKVEKTELRFVEYIKITPKKPDRKKEFFGFIKAGGETELGFETSGMIKKIFFTDGDAVKKGEVIAILDNEINELEERENSAKLQDAYVQYENAKSYYERIDKLHQVGGISDNDWDKAKTNMQSRLHQIEISKEILQSSRKKAGYGKLYAPDDGIILRKISEENQYTNAGQPILIFQDNRNTEAKIFVSEKYINKIQKGMKVEITTDPLIDGYKKTKIKSITKTSIDEGAYRVTLIFDKKYLDLKDGMAIRAYIDFSSNEEPVKEVIQIPIGAMLKDENLSYVWLLYDINDDTAKIKKQIIKVLDLQDNFAIVEGLRRNDLIVAKGVSEVMDGQKVKIRAIE